MSQKSSVMQLPQFVPKALTSDTTDRPIIDLLRQTVSQFIAPVSSWPEIGR